MAAIECSGALSGNRRGSGGFSRIFMQISNADAYSKRRVPLFFLRVIVLDLLSGNPEEPKLSGSRQLQVLRPPILTVTQDTVISTIFTTSQPTASAHPRDRPCFRVHHHPRSSVLIADTIT